MSVRKKQQQAESKARPKQASSKTRAKQVEVRVITDAVVVKGETHPNGSTVRVAEQEAKQLEREGKVARAT